MRRRVYVLAIAAALLLTACGQSQAEENRQLERQTEVSAEASMETKESQTPAVTADTAEGEVDTENESADTEETKILIAYFTWADNTVLTDQEIDLDAVTSASLVSPGNTEILAEWIGQETGGDLFSITVMEPYPADYDECLDRAALENAENARPELSSHVEDMDAYDTVFLGFPNWYYSLPMPVFSFLEEYDFSGKTVIPFCAHGTGGLAGTIQDLEAALPESAVVAEPFDAERSEIAGSQPQLKEWLDELGYAG